MKIREITHTIPERTILAATIDDWLELAETGPLPEPTRRLIRDTASGGVPGHELRIVFLPKDARVVLAAAAGGVDAVRTTMQG